MVYLSDKSDVQGALARPDEHLQLVACLKIRPRLVPPLIPRPRAYPANGSIHLNEDLSCSRFY